MLVYDLCTVGNKMLAIRKRMGMTQAEVAEAAGLCDRTYAEIERGTVNMRLETLLRICNALRITPDEILTDDRGSLLSRKEELLERLDKCSLRDQEAALTILMLFLRAVE